jgi:hypothetical protein
MSSNDEKVSKTLDCINTVKLKLDKKGVLTFKEVEALSSGCGVDTDYLFGNMSFDKGIKIDYKNSELKKS